MARSRAAWIQVAMLWCCGVVMTTQGVGAVGLPAKAPGPANAENAPATLDEPVEPGSPRATVAEYVRLCRAGNFAGAARYLDVPAAQTARSPVLARRLKAVLDRHVWLDFETVSPAAQGDTNDGLPAAYEAIAKIPSEGHQPEPVRLFRRSATGQSPAWVFSRSTVEHIDAWYEALPQRWTLDHLPAWLQRAGPRELLIWQWIALPCMFLLAWGLSALLDQVSRRLIARLVFRASKSWDAERLQRLRGPLTLIWALSLLYAAHPLLGLYQPAEQFARQLLRGGYFFALFWALSRLIEASGRIIADSPWARTHSSGKALVPIGVRLAKILLLVIAVVALVSAMGYPAASIVAGLGVGGLAVALAAQKTIENLFGAFTLGADEPFRVGDFVKVEDFSGTVESIGLRSTRIRTLDRTLITIPNGRLSEMRLESYAARDRIRLATNLGLAHGTTSAQLRAILDGCAEVLRAQPKLWPEGVTLRLKDLTESAIVIEVQAWFQTTDFAEFQQIRESLLLDFLRVVEREGASFALPNRGALAAAEAPPPRPPRT